MSYRYTHILTWIKKKSKTL